MTSLVIIVAADKRVAANALAEAFGKGPDNLSVPLSQTGAEPATHYGALAAETWPELLSRLGAIVAGSEPPPPGWTQQQVSDAVAGMIVSTRADVEPAVHIEEVLVAQDLRRVIIGGGPQ